MVLTGNISAENFIQLALDFDYTKYKNITFENITIQDCVYENGYSCSLEPHLSHRIVLDGIKLPALLKLFLNTHNLQKTSLYQTTAFSHQIIKHYFIFQKRKVLSSQIT